MKNDLLKPSLTRQQWDAACVVRVCPWSGYIWRGSVAIGQESGNFRVVTPDGVDRPGNGETPEKVIESASEYYLDYVNSRRAKGGET